MMICSELQSHYVLFLPYGHLSSPRIRNFTGRNSARNDEEFEGLKDGVPPKSINSNLCQRPRDDFLIESDRIVCSSLRGGGGELGNLKS